MNSLMTCTHMLNNLHHSILVWPDHDGSLLAPDSYGGGLVRISYVARDNQIAMMGLLTANY